MKDERMEQLRDLVETNYKRLKNLLHQLARKGFEGEDVNDVVQDAFKHFWGQIEKGNLGWILDFPSPMTTIIWYLQRYSLKDAKKKNGNRKIKDKRYIAIDPKVHDRPDEKDVEDDKTLDALELDRAISRLPEKSQVLLKLRFVERWPIAKIAENFACSKRTINRKLREIMDFLAGELGI